MRRREINYFRWNTEARAIVASAIGVFVVTVVIEELGFGKVAALFFCPALAASSAWCFTYLWRAGNQRRAQWEFQKNWGSHCHICRAKPGERCDAGLHG